MSHAAPTFDTVTCEKVGRVFGRTRALQNFSFELRAGEVTALVGTNGAGKSTLLAILSTLLSPSSGSVRYGELSFREAGERARGSIGLVSHAALVYPQLSARENLDFFGKLHHVPERRAAIEAMLQKVGLIQAAWDRPASTYSRGMLQRLALARALMTDPRLLLLDEPFTGLDREASERLIEIVRQAKAAGRIVLLVSHDLQVTAELADRTVILARGKLQHVVEEPVSGEQLSELYRQHTAAVKARASA
ncbi:MAG: ABC transporter ATP-binding protein [Deltaproteobacteria bacterium]|nr:ABC transporter ATP-binding protein [Deltaproteobacteria bacterium]